MNRKQPTHLLSIGIVAAAALAACGGAGDAKAPAKAAEPMAPVREPTSIEEAQEQIARARDEVALGEAKKADADKDSMKPGAATSGTTTPREESPRTAAADSCSQSCRALSSMRRAVTALCRMTGEEDARCSDAKKTLSDSESRVARCHCGT